MTRTKRLKECASAAAIARGHSMRRFGRVQVADGRETWQTECRRCGAWVQVQPNPAPNGIDIGGSAVAVGCEA
jgi:hypothetical protein